jgi:hypothetical protein
MKIRNSWLVVTLAVVGLVACAVTFLRFVTTITGNALPWRPGLDAREFYLAVGDAYSRGFQVGFFFAFFLVVLALAVAGFVQRRRRAVRRLEVAPEARRPLPNPEA